MKTIFMVCRSETETPSTLVKLIGTLFPECELHVVYETSQGFSTGPEANPGYPSPSVPMKLK